MTPTLRTLLGRDAFAAAPDADLLARYATERDDVAFAELVHRHAPAVYAACRRFLSDPASLDDAFQAVFVLLSKKAAALRHPDRLHGWLCGAAGRIARKLRDRTAKRTATERPLADVPEPAAVEKPPADLTAVLDEELARLPTAYREVVRLCDVDGVSRRTAAKRLGIPHATLSNRLVRARAMLGGRLLRRGVALGAGLSLSSVAVASVPADLVSLAVSRVASGVVPPQVLALIPHGVPVMSASRLVLLALVFGAGVGLAALAVVNQQQPPPPAADAARNTPPDAEGADGDSVVQACYSPDGKLLAAVEVDNEGRIGPSRVTLFDARTGAVVRRFTDPADYPASAAFSTDGRTLFVAHRGGGLRAWDVATGEPGRSVRPEVGRYAALFRSPDGKRLGAVHLEGTDKEPMRKLQLFDAATGRPTRSIESEVPFASGCAFSPDGKRVATNCQDRAGGFRGVIEWDTATGEEANRFPAAVPPAGASSVFTRLAYTADGKQLVVAGGSSLPLANGRVCSTSGAVWVFDREAGTVAKVLVNHIAGDYVREFALSADGKKLYAAVQVPGQEVELGGGWRTARFDYRCWDTATWELDGSRPDTAQSGPGVFALSPESNHLAVSHGTRFGLLDAHTGEPVRTLLRKRR